jgi:hypothetical protein
LLHHPEPPTTKYGKAMAFLKSTESSPQVGTGKIPGPTVVDRYVEKQIAWAAAQGKWVGAKAASEGMTGYFNKMVAITDCNKRPPNCPKRLRNRWPW